MSKTNGLTVEAQLPILTVVMIEGPPSHMRGLPASSDTPVMVNFHMPDAGTYDWSPTPDSVDNVATWNQPLKALSIPIAISGTDASTAAQDNLRIFLAGILLGIAGSAAVGAIQEYTHRKQDKPPVQIAAPVPPN